MSTSTGIEANVQKILQAVETLSNLEQELLFDLLKERQIKKRRQELAASITEAHREYRMGQTQTMTVDELMASLNDEEDSDRFESTDPQPPMNVPLISDSQALIVKAFLVALSQQDTIPQGLPNNLRNIARDLSKNIAEIDAIAEQIPALATDYNWAYNLLIARSAERGMGLEFITDGSPDATLSADIDNSVPDPNQRPKITDILQQLEQMDNAALTDKTRDIFTAADPLEELKTAFNLGQYGF